MDGSKSWVHRSGPKVWSGLGLDGDWVPGLGLMVRYKGWRPRLCINDVYQGRVPWLANKVRYQDWVSVLYTAMCMCGCMHGCVLYVVRG